MRCVSLVGVALMFSGCATLQKNFIVLPDSHSSISSSFAPSIEHENQDPISDARDRVTKKPFGIYVTPLASPISPERFTGYHTGEDFETFPDEAATDVPVSAIFTGQVRYTGWVKGYGGVLIQQCIYRQQSVTILYGHLNISSVSLRTGSELAAGAPIGVLGKGYSTQTDGERKHLHLAVHRGTVLDFHGYVTESSGLAQWVNPRLLLGY